MDLNMPMRKAGLVACVLVLSALAGCVGEPGPEAPRDRSVPVARQPGVEDPARYELRVTADTPDGTPVPGATVVFFNATGGEEYPAEPFYVNGTEWPCGETMDLEASPEWNMLAIGRTGPEGRVVGSLDEEASLVSVAAGWIDGYTTEVNLHGMTQGACVPTSFNEDPWTDGTQTLPLYHDHHRVALDGRLDASVSGAFLPGDVDDPARLSEPVWDATTVQFVDPELPNLHHLARLARLDLVLAWNNTATEHADLTVAAGDHDPAFWGTDTRQLPVSGPSSETLERGIPHHGLEARRVGPVANATVLTPDGLDWTIAGDATFAGTDVRLPGADT